MNVLFICTSNKDRSPALEEFFKHHFPNNSYRSAGVNKYFTAKKGTHYLTIEDIEWANLIVYAEPIHYTIADRDFKATKVGFKDCLTLNLGEYTQGHVGEDYLLRALVQIEKHLK